MLGFESSNRQKKVKLVNVIKKNVIILRSYGMVIIFFKKLRPISSCIFNLLIIYLLSNIEFILGSRVQFEKLWIAYESVDLSILWFKTK